jgi:3',5'-cyclic AMP phosphodiesterase CpdA
VRRRRAGMVRAVVASSVLVVSDSHLSPRAPEANANWSAVVAVAERFDLVLHAGDLTLDGARHPEDVEHAASLLRALPVPWAAIPGNHDIGDNVGAAHGPEVTADRIRRWDGCVGPDRWSRQAGAWTVVGINAQLFGSGLDEERQQWQWLRDVLGAQRPGAPVLLVTHKPLSASDDELEVAPVVRFVPEPARTRLQGLLDATYCPVVLSGHVHQHRVLEHGGRRHVWASTTWAVLPEVMQPTVGLRRSGVLALELGDDGTVSVAFEEPPELRQFTLGREILDPYG